MALPYGRNEIKSIKSINRNKIMTTKTNERTHATEGTKTHYDLANEKNYISYLMIVKKMTRNMAKKTVEAMKKRGEPLMTNEQINRAIAAQKRLDAAEEKRKAKEAEEAKKREEAKKKAEEAARQKWAEEAKKREETKKKTEEAKKREEPKTEKTEEPKTEKKIKQGKVGISINGVKYSSICAGMKAVGIPDHGTTNWSKIRNGLKKSGQVDFNYEGQIYSFIQL
jgi:membrane protein involved in colicin uptake